MTTLVVIAAALGAALGFAASTSLQHRAATSAPCTASGTSGLFRHLVGRPSWHLGLLTGGMAFVLHAVAVRHGALALVQPIMVSGIVFALPVRAVLDRKRPAIPEIAWAAVTASGLALLVVAAKPTTASSHPLVSHTVGILVAGAVAAAACSWCGMAASSARVRGLLLGGGSGILFGLVAGDIKLLVLHGAHGPGTVLLIGALVILGGWGLALNQRAYQVAPLSVSMPVLNIVDVAVAIAFGLWVFHEVPAHQPSALFGEGIGVALMALGARRLAHGSVRPRPEPVAQARDAELVSAGGS